MRIEKDSLGEREISNKNYYGIHTSRAMENFSLNYKKVNIELIKAYSIVKLAAVEANFKAGKIEEKKYKLISEACSEIYTGKYNGV